MTADLPMPEEERWRILRAGLVDLFYYDIEEFHFHRGNLLLRGNNGTGKSKVLALTLPFLLDGEMAAHRVEPDGDKQKKMEWNLLLGGRFPHPERLGYTWLEFGRLDADGTSQFRTVGCGLKAVKDRGIARHWYFVTDQRVGTELSLVSPTRTALPRERLKEALTGRGHVYDTASEYRRAVDQALFGLGPRYDALVTLLIQLRQPQLSKRPDERLLSQALTTALPPLDDNLLIQVAEAFRSLDDERTTLEAMQQARRSADDFLQTYTRYARVAAKRKATALRTAHSRYEQLGRDLAEQQRASQEAEQLLIAAENQIAGLDGARNVLQARRQALEDSPEMRAAKDLEQAGNYAADLERLAVTQQRLLDDAVASEAEAQRQAEEARDEAESALELKESTSDDAARSAQGARIAREHGERVVTAAGETAPPYKLAKQTAEELVRWRGQSLSHLDGLITKAENAKEAVLAERRETERVGGEISAADERIIASEEAAAAAGVELVAAMRAHLEHTTQLRVPDLESLLGGLEIWAETLDGPNPAMSAINTAAQAAAHELARREAQLSAERDAALSWAGETERDLERLAQGGHDNPPVPHTRSSGARTGPGAPLWRVTDFTDGVSEQDRAGIEAALEAAGILDAWVSPDGTLIAEGTDDVVLAAAPKAAKNHLGRVLHVAAGPAEAAGLKPATVQRVLESIGLGEQPGVAAWVDVEGRFHNGVLFGQWRKDVAVHIGEGAREAARQVRIADLTALLTEIHAEIDELAGKLEALAAQREVLSEEIRSVPADIALRDAFIVVRGEREARRRLLARYQEMEKKIRELVALAGDAEQAAMDFAQDVGLPVDRLELKRIGDALGEYRIALTAWWSACTAAASAVARSAAAVARHATAASKTGPARDEHANAVAKATAARERHTALLEASGSTIAELQRQLAFLRDELSRVDREAKQAAEHERAALLAKGQADGKQESLAAEITHASELRENLVELLRQFATTGLLELACPQVETPDPDQPWAATPAVLAARGIDRELSDVDESERRWELVQQHVSNDSKTLIDGLSRHGHRAAVTQRGDILVVEVNFQGRIVPVTVLAGTLAAEVEERQRILSAHEREVLENHLVNEVAGALQELISAAERQVGNMNQELEQRPTSTGMQLRLVWRTGKDAPAGLAALRDRQLRQTTDVWNEDDRRLVGAFLQQQIANERLRDSSGTWIEQLTRALDYRSWHEFIIQRRQDGQWRPAAGPASGGERVLAASIPLFAAAASYYSSAHPHAPRLIALDEAFAGVDDDSRAKCLGLLATFDLDVVMTSEREWGCYPQVPGLAIAQLARRDGIDAVLVTPWRWDGHHPRYQVPRPVPYVPSQPASGEQLGLDL